VGKNDLHLKKKINKFVTGKALTTNPHACAPKTMRYHSEPSLFFYIVTQKLFRRQLLPRFSYQRFFDTQ